MQNLTPSPLRRLGRRLGGLAPRLAVAVERRWDAAWLARTAGRPPRHFRIETYGGHGARQVVVRGRVTDNEEPAAAVEGEGTRAAAQRTLARFLTRDLPGVPLRIRVGSATVETVTDIEGYFHVRLDPGLPADAGPWVTGEVALGGTYRGLTGEHTAPLRVRVSSAGAAFGVISDVDDTILHTGAQRLVEMVVHTFTGSALTRTPMPGAPELYRALAAGRQGADENPVCYVSSSPWNLHGFLDHFLEVRGFPLGPLLLRDLLGDGRRRGHAVSKHAHIAEVLELHPDLPFVLLGDSGQHDPEIYADAVRRFPGRIRAVYIREVRLDPGDGRVESVTAAWEDDVPFVVAADSAAMARHAAEIGLISASAADAIERASAT